MPKRVACTSAGGADIGMAVVAVDSPGMEHPLVVNQLVARTAHVIHDFILAVFLQCLTNASTEIIQDFVPGHTFPFALTPFAGTPQGIKNALRIIHLVDGCGSLGAVAA